MDEKDQEVNHEERDRLLYELVVRQSALEKALVDAKVISERSLAEAQLECMEKLKSVIEQADKNRAAEAAEPQGGFIKYGEKYEDESREKE